MKTMQIEKIVINHYKSIKSPISLEDLSGFYVLVGPNNAGKTNVLDAIHLFFEKNLEKERFFDKDTDMEMIVKENGKNHKIVCREGKFAFPSEVSLGKHFVRINEKIDYRKVIRDLEILKSDHPGAYRAFSSVLEKNFKDIEMNEELFLLNVYADNKPRPVQRMGEGFKRLFVILFYIFHPEYKIILIDEPEVHLHPSVIRKFLYILEEKQNEKQVFLTTHHPTFVQANYLPYVWRVTRDTSGNTTLHTFRKKDVDLNRFVQEINDDNSGMLFSDKVLLVEGISDRIFMREIINRFYKKEKDIKVVYTSGKGSVDLYARLCETFNIPYAVMLDRDALNSASLQRIRKFPKFKRKTSLKEKIEKLKEKEIFILEKDLEHTYPEKFRNKETKPLAALFASKKISEKDLQEGGMKIIGEILKKI